jgi:uncharacterized damage-inducible protein DinB
VDTNDVQDLFAYDSWANRRLLGAAAHLTSEEFERDLGASFGSVRGTLIHIMWGEKRWLQRWVDGSRLRDLSPAEFPDCSSLREGWARVDDDRRAFVAQLTDAGLTASMSIRGQTFTLAELIKHVGNHSTYHRGQIVLLLRLLGHTPPATDYGLYLAESREPAA